MNQHDRFDEHEREIISNHVVRLLDVRQTEISKSDCRTCGCISYRVFPGGALVDASCICGHPGSQYVLFIRAEFVKQYLILDTYTTTSGQYS